MKKTIGISILLCVFTLTSGQQNQKITKKDVLEAMKRASGYMAQEVSYHGGYLWMYAEDFSELFGEGQARNTQIWVQNATPQMGDLFLEMYRFTSDTEYLQYAKRAADALIYGQHPLGGWHYFIDFDPDGTSKWYEEVASQYARGMEEYRYYYGNCTFDDDVTQGATRFLLHLYMETLDPAYFTPLKKALDFILMAQYPNGGWPQRYPLRYDFVHEEFDDYTSNYTLNDDAMNNTIRTLLEAYKALGNDEYLEAARRGGDFFLISQGPEELPGWSEQYDINIQPDWGRTHEPPAYGTRQTAHTLDVLMELFLFTGDQRYLRPVPATLEWMESEKIRELENGVYELARYYDPVTFLPIDYEVLEKKSPDGYILLHYFPSDKQPFTGPKANVSFMKMKDEYELLSKLNHEEVKKLYAQRSRQSKFYRNPDEREVNQLISSRNENGIWNEELSVFDMTKTMVVPSDPMKFDPMKLMRGFSIHTYMNNMRILMGYIHHLK